MRPSPDSNFPSAISIPCSRNDCFAFSISPSASSSARLQSIIPTPVSSRSFFISSVVTTIKISSSIELIAIQLTSRFPQLLVQLAHHSYPLLPLPQLPLPQLLQVLLLHFRSRPLVLLPVALPIHLLPLTLLRSPQYLIQLALLQFSPLQALLPWILLLPLPQLPLQKLPAARRNGQHLLFLL